MSDLRGGFDGRVRAHTHHERRPIELAYGLQWRRITGDEEHADHCAVSFRLVQVKTWTTDGFYRETVEMVQYRKEEGCQVVEMECSALAACAKFRRVTWAMLLFSADTLADPHKYQEREWGKTSISIALELALDAVLSVVEE
ncbi:hypothetical protein LF915_00380 [Bifidobacterium pseudolongum]|uniref:phosphorylase family protein n=1 Tax=Bifidobacterium pseudolongum TaxID=1694 RepID=UPI001F0DECF6|nr:hypothetical protein [Bifidobacterium pseudolongum]MCH4841658.1 hypothetical protein [Bifidobacterium pseudolongum]